MKIMNVIAVSLLAATISFLVVQADEPAQETRPPAFPPPATVVEARARARLLHETIHGALQVMHRDFFDEEESHSIPSASLEDVFSELSKSYDVDAQWLIVDTDVVNVDHQPKDEFERKAAKELARGKPYFESAEKDRYRYAGPIRLASQCLKCHVKNRTKLDDRTAGLLISMPLGKRVEDTKELRVP